MVTHIPVWVYFLFAGLVVLGVWLGRPRAVTPGVQIGVAIGFLVYSLWGVANAFGSAISLLLWGLGVLLSVSLLQRLFVPPGLARSELPFRVVVAGSWVPLLLIMGIFVARFLIGFAQGAQLPLATHPLFSPVLSMGLGLLSGGFAARAIAVRRFARQSQGDGRPALA